MSTQSSNQKPPRDGELGEHPKTKLFFRRVRNPEPQGLWSGLSGAKRVTERASHDGQLPCNRFTPKPKGSSLWSWCNPGKMERTGGLKLPEKHVNKNISIISLSTGGTEAWDTVNLSKCPFYPLCASFRLEARDSPHSNGRRGTA